MDTNFSCSFTPLSTIHLARIINLKTHECADVCCDYNNRVIVSVHHNNATILRYEFLSGNEAIHMIDRALDPQCKDLSCVYIAPYPLDFETIQGFQKPRMSEVVVEDAT